MVGLPAFPCFAHPFVNAIPQHVNKLFLSLRFLCVPCALCGRNRKGAKNAKVRKRKMLLYWRCTVYILCVLCAIFVPFVVKDLTTKGTKEAQSSQRTKGQFETISRLKRGLGWVGAGTHEQGYCAGKKITCPNS